MGRTPDRTPGPLIEDEEVQLVANATPPSAEGAFNYNGSAFQMYDSLGIFDPRSGSANFDDILLDDEGRIVYIGDGQFVLRG